VQADRLTVGVVTGTHGVKGELKVRVFAQGVDHLADLGEAVFRKAGREQTLRIESVRSQAAGAILLVAGYSDPERARALVGSEIWVPRAQASPLAKGEFYQADLQGCRVWFGAEEIGSVRSVWEGGPVPLLEIAGREGKVHMVPFTDHFVGDVDTAAGRIELRDDEIIR
jgi:16S rRNA processing protein RimM